jgi:hypothetical protein
MLIWVIVGVVAVLLFFLRRREGFTQPPGVRFVAVVSTTYLQMSQLKVMAGGTNVAQGKPVGSLSEIVPGMAQKAVDGTSAARAFPDIYQSNTELSAWAVDLGQEYMIDEIVFYNRADGCGDRATKMRMILFNASKEQVGEDVGPFTGEKEQHFTFTPASSTAPPPASATPPAPPAAPAAPAPPASPSAVTATACSIKESRETCLGSMDENNEYCTWSAAKGACTSSRPVSTVTSGSTSQLCRAKTSKTDCTSTPINAEDNLYCSWSDTTNQCSFMEEGDAPTMTYNAAAGVQLPANVSTSCSACVGANYYWNPTIKQCSPTDTPGYSRSC